MSRISFRYSSTRSGHSLKTKNFPKYGPTPGLNPTFILSSPNDVRLKIVGGGVEYRLGRPHSNPIPALCFSEGIPAGQSNSIFDHSIDPIAPTSNTADRLN